MIWTLIKKPTDLIEVDDYRKYKNELAKESNHKCVYCCIKESSFGGIRNFHVEHYRPKSKFKLLENTYSNLFYSCSICNCFKGNDWPNEPDDNYKKAFYPNPSEVNFSNIIKIDFLSGLVHGENFTANFLIHKLYLNRPQLILERKHISELKRFEILLEKFNKRKSFLKNKILKGDDKAYDILSKIMKVHEEISILMINPVRPYTEKQIKKDDK